MRSKRKSKAQLIGDEAVRVLESLLPSHWTARPYHPDFGLDLAIEIFDDPKTDGRGYTTADTLGEHFFVQVKGAERLVSRAFQIRSRSNVERFSDPASRKGTTEPGSVIRTFPIQLDTPEIVTVQRMGAAVPVLLVGVDITERRAFFVCLNDYIEKILLPAEADYAKRASKVIHVPEMNEILPNDDALVPLRFYGKRAKLMAAFEKFAYQNSELGYTRNSDLQTAANHFAHILLRYDFWERCEFWYPIGYAHRGLQNLLRTGTPGVLVATDEGRSRAEETEPEGAVWTDQFGESHSLKAVLQINDVRALWNQLANLGKVHEEVCREWFLPTHLGTITR